MPRGIDVRTVGISQGATINNGALRGESRTHDIRFSGKFSRRAARTRGSSHQEGSKETDTVARPDAKEALETVTVLRARRTDAHMPHDRPRRGEPDTARHTNHSPLQQHRHTCANMITVRPQTAVDNCAKNQETNTSWSKQQTPRCGSRRRASAAREENSTQGKQTSRPVVAQSHTSRPLHLRSLCLFDNA